MTLINKEELVEKIQERRKELLSKPGLIASSYYAEEDANILALINELCENDAQLTVTQPNGYSKLDAFKPGDIIYAFETQDYLTAIFQLPEDYKGEDCFDAEMIVFQKDTWSHELPGTTMFDVEPDMWFRPATEEDKEIFNSHFKK